MLDLTRKLPKQPAGLRMQENAVQGNGSRPTNQNIPKARDI